MGLGAEALPVARVVVEVTRRRPLGAVLPGPDVPEGLEDVRHPSHHRSSATNPLGGAASNVARRLEPCCRPLGDPER